MNAAERWKVTPLEDYAWPVTYRYRMRAPWGDTQTEMSLDVPALQGDLNSSLKLGGELWRRAIAPAITRHVELLGTDVVMWRYQPSALPMSESFSKGLLVGTPAPRADSACLVLLTGHFDKMGFRRLFLPGIREAWVAGGLLTRTARGALQDLSYSLVMGLCTGIVGAPYTWLIAYRDLLPATSSNPSGVSFRPVQGLRVCHHTEKAPEPSGMPWP